jgi:TonB family protein
MFRQISILLFLCLVGFCAAVEAQIQAGKPLLITSKPRADYTDAARENNIQGKVQVRVTFLPDGTIGDVTDVRRNNENLRKFGLVKSAMEAARKIKFQPQMKKGKPVKAVKILEYPFTLY